MILVLMARIIMFTFGLNDVSRLLPMFYVILCSINLNYILYFIFLFQTCTADVIVQLNGVFGWINRPPTTGDKWRRRRRKRAAFADNWDKKGE